VVRVSGKLRDVLRSLTRREVIDQVRAVAQPIVMVVVAYVGFLNNSPQVAVVASLALLIYTAYVLSWYVSRTVELRRINVDLRAQLMRGVIRLRSTHPRGLGLGQ